MSDLWLPNNEDFKGKGWDYLKSLPYRNVAKEGEDFRPLSPSSASKSFNPVNYLAYIKQEGCSSYVFDYGLVLETMLTQSGRLELKHFDFGGKTIQTKAIFKKWQELNERNKVACVSTKDFEIIQENVERFGKEHPEVLRMIRQGEHESKFNIEIEGLPFTGYRDVFYNDRICIEIKTIDDIADVKKRITSPYSFKYWVAAAVYPCQEFIFVFVEKKKQGQFRVIRFDKEDLQTVRSKLSQKFINPFKAALKNGFFKEEETNIKNSLNFI